MSKDLYSKRLESLFSDADRVAPDPGRPATPAPDPAPAAPAEAPRAGAVNGRANGAHDPAPASAPVTAPDLLPGPSASPRRTTGLLGGGTSDADRFFDLSQELLCIVGPDGLFKRVNPAFERTLGWTVRELLKARFLDLVHPGDLPATTAETDKLRQGATAVRVANRFRCRDGQDRWISWIVQATSDGALYIIGHDITDRRQAEEALRESEARYRSLVESSYDAVVSVGGDGRFLFFNRVWLDTLGYTAEEMSRRTLFEVMHPESVTHCQPLFARLMAGEPLNGIEVTFVTRDGASVVMEGNSSPRWHNGQVVATQTIFRNITARRQAEDDLLKFRYALEHSTDAVFMTDLNGVIQYVNPAFEALYGYPRSEAIGRTPRILKSGLIPPDQYAHFWKALLNKQVVAGEIVNKTKEGRLIPIEGSNTPIVNGAGEIVGFMAIHRDISARKQFEERLQLQSTALASMSSAVVITDPMGFIQWVNPAFTAITGYSLEEAIGQHTSVMKSGQHDAGVYQELWNTLLAGRVWRGELINRRKDGRLYPEEQVITPVKNERGEIAWFVSVKQDITERKQAEAALARRTSELEMLNDIGRILAATSDLKTALGEVGAKLCQTFRVDTGFVALYDPRTNLLEFPYNLDAGQPLEVAPRLMTGGLTAHVIRTRQPLLLSEASAERLRALGAVLVGSGDYAQSWLGVPIPAGADVIGVLNVQAAQPNWFTPEDVRLLSTIAASIGAEIENARLYEQARRRASELAVINEIMGFAASSLDVNQTLDVAAREVAGLVKARSCGVGLLDADRRFLTIVADHGDPDQPKAVGLRLPLEGNLSTVQAIQTRRTVVIANAQTDPLTESVHALMRERRTYALVIVPLVARNDVIGTIALDSDDPTRQFAPDEIAILETVARELGGAIENARLFEQVQRRAADLATVAQVGATVAALRDQDAMLQTVVDLTKERFLLYHAHVYLLNAERDTLVLVSGAGEVGRQMVAEGRRIPLSRRQSLVAQAARERRAVLVNDVRQDPNFLPHPLLPDTRAELAAPLMAGDEVLGVLDVQSDQAGRFGEADASIQTALAAQVAVALQNARSFQRSEQALADLNTLTRRLTRENWRGYLSANGAQDYAYQYDVSAVEPLQAIAEPAPAPEPGLARPLVVQGEAVGQLRVAEPGLADAEAQAIVNAVAERLSAHLENLRLTEQTMESLSRQERLSAQLETVVQVTTVASTLLEARQLLQEVVDLTQARFGLQQARIYLYDDVGETLQLAAWSGADAEAPSDQARILPVLLAQSTVARAARTRQPVIVHDAQTAPGDLADMGAATAGSEMALPMLVGERLLGVFDVRADQAGRFTEEDARIQGTLAAQVAIALQNANLYAEQAATVARLKELDHLKSTFLANMSHELRTPLNSILGFTDVILEGLDGPLTDRMDNDLRVVQKNGQHLLNLINDILDMAKIEAGRMTINPEVIHLADLIDEVMDITGSLAREKRLQLTPQLPPDEDLVVEADHVRLRQVLINLVGNAIKFTERGGVTVSAEPQGEKLLICVADTGIGIPPAKLDTIFEAFSQVDTSTTRKVGGTGLGLPISRHLIELHGGRLWAESSGVAGEGSRFYIELPAEFKRPALETATA